MNSFNSEECNEGTSCRCFICRSTLDTLTTPAAASKWPILLLIEPMAQVWFSTAYDLKALVNPLISMDRQAPCRYHVPRRKKCFGHQYCPFQGLTKSGWFAL